MFDVTRKKLVPGKVLAVSLRDPMTRAVLLRAGTALTPAIIRLLYRTRLAAQAASCVGDESHAEAIAFPQAKVAHDPELERRRRLHEAMASLRTLLGSAAIGAGCFAWLSGSQLDLEAALAAAGLLAMVFAASYQVASQTRALLRRTQGGEIALLPEPASEPQAARVA